MKHNYSLTKGNVEGCWIRTLLMLKTRSKHFLIEVGMPRKQNLSFNLLSLFLPRPLFLLLSLRLIFLLSGLNWAYSIL